MFQNSIQDADPGDHTSPRREHTAVMTRPHKSPVKPPTARPSRTRRWPSSTRKWPAARIKLVEADAQARKEIVGVHHDLQAERTRLDTSWNELEGERRQIAGQRRTESMLVPVTSLVGGGLLVVVLLGFCWYALVAVRRGDDTDAELNELLIHEILPDEPPLLSVGSRPPALLRPIPA